MTPGGRNLGTVGNDSLLSGRPVHSNLPRGPEETPGPWHPYRVETGGVSATSTPATTATQTLPDPTTTVVSTPDVRPSLLRQPTRRQTGSRGRRGPERRRKMKVEVTETSEVRISTG